MPCCAVQLSEASNNTGILSSHTHACHVDIKLYLVNRKLPTPLRTNQNTNSHSGLACPTTYICYTQYHVINSKGYFMIT